MEYAREQEIIRLLYLISLYDSGHIQMIQFLDEGITNTYTNNKQIQFYFETARAYNKDGFENKITDNLNTMLIVSEDPSVEGNEDAIVKYYSFELDIEENIDPKEGNNKDNEAKFDLKEGKDVYNKENQDKRKSNNIEKSVAKKNKISIAEESEDESEEDVENGKLIKGKDKVDLVKNESNEVEEESNKVEGSNEIEEKENDEEEFGDNDDEIGDNDDEIGDNDDEIGDNDNEFGDEFKDNNDEFGDDDDEDKEEIINKKRKIKELQTSKKRMYNK
ncbi:hypothetical protein F8M41_011909 [Gigaspora margarita]|uniref:Uncharacterized protein n=1 Tax=Gigaspora margarita TaxID=4874 RepID=A0A8H3X0I4_GIGMA|nr:hypothetical protein F8M41_011909 [Gigaspora margarita]